MNFHNCNDWKQMDQQDIRFVPPHRTSFSGVTSYLICVLLQRIRCSKKGNLCHCQGFRHYNNKVTSYFSRSFDKKVTSYRYSYSISKVTSYRYFVTVYWFVKESNFKKTKKGYFPFAVGGEKNVRTPEKTLNSVIFWKNTLKSVIFWEISVKVTKISFTCFCRYSYFLVTLISAVTLLL